MNRAQPAGKLHGFDASLIRGMGVIALFAALSGLARIAQDAAIAWRYGTGPVVDAYYFVLNLAGWPVAVALSVLTCLVTPVDAVLRHSDPPLARRLRAEVLGCMILVAVLSFPLAWWAMAAIAGSTLGGLEQATSMEAAAGIPGLAAMVPLGMISALLSAWFIAGNRLALTFLEAIPPFALAVLVLAIPGQVLYWGTSAGLAVQVLLMALILRLAGELPRPSLGMPVAARERLSAGAVALLVGQVLFALVPLVDAAFAVRLGEGLMSALSFANRLILGILGLLGLALARAGLPLLSQLSNQSPTAALGAASRWMAWAALAGTLMALGVSLFADVVVALLFERGSFMASDSEQVATLLRYGVWQVPFYLGGIVLVTALASAKANHALALVATTGLISKILFSATLAPSYGPVGLQIATVLMYVTNSTVAWMMLLRHCRPEARPSSGTAM